MTKFKCNLSIRNILVATLIIIVVLALINGISKYAGKTVEALDGTTIETPAVYCSADYGADSATAKANHICPKDMPTCNQYVPGKFMGTCGYKKAPNKIIDFVFSEPRPPPPPKPCTWIAKENGYDYPDNDLISFPNLTLEQCKQKCQDGQSAGCKGIVYDAADKTCWIKRSLGTPSSHTNRQGFILNPGCPKPKIPPPPPNIGCCTGWQQTLNCLGTGPPDTKSSYLMASTGGSHTCSVTIPSGASGYCTCKDGKKLAFDCGHTGFNCEEECSKQNCSAVSLKPPPKPKPKPPPPPPPPKPPTPPPTPAGFKLLTKGDINTGYCPFIRPPDIDKGWTIPNGVAGCAAECMKSSKCNAITSSSGRCEIYNSGCNSSTFIPLKPSKDNGTRWTFQKK